GSGRSGRSGVGGGGGVRGGRGGRAAPGDADEQRSGKHAETTSLREHRQASYGRCVEGEPQVAELTPTSTLAPLAPGGLHPCPSPPSTTRCERRFGTSSPRSSARTRRSGRRPSTSPTRSFGGWASSDS